MVDNCYACDPRIKAFVEERKRKKQELKQARQDAYKKEQEAAKEKKLEEERLAREEEVISPPAPPPSDLDFKSLIFLRLVVRSFKIPNISDLNEHCISL